MKILVTGHLGFVGRHLCKALEMRGDVVLGFDVIEGYDIAADWMPDDVDRVFNLAARTDAQSDDSECYARVNVVGAARVFAKYGDKVVHASTSMVNYPVTPYAITKAAAEELARYHGCAVVRLCNLFGKGGHSVIDKFEQAETLIIRGDGEQRRTYAPVEAGVYELMTVGVGMMSILRGRDMTVNEVAGLHPNKQMMSEPAHPLDILDGRQV